MSEQEISLSIEETNKLRISLGLKPLVLDKVGPNLEKTAEENYAEHKAKLEKAKQELQLKEKIERFRVERERQKKLTGKTLADEVNDEEIRSWIQKTGSRASVSARKTVNKKADVQEYSSNELSGLKIAHNIEDIAEGDETVLVLKDSFIGEEEEPLELVNLNLLEAEKTRRNLENKKKKPVYNPYDEYDEQKGILSKYDDIIEGEKEEFLVIGHKGNINVQNELSKKEPEMKPGFVSLDYEKAKEVDDYQSVDSIKFKKSKSKKKSRKKEIDFSIEISNPFEYSNASKISNTENFVDDDELQNAIANIRKKASKRQKTDVDLAKALDIAKSTEKEFLENEGIEFSTTSEFTRTLRLKKDNLNGKYNIINENYAPDQDVSMETSDQEEMELGSDIDENPVDISNDQQLDSFTQEPLISSGLAATLNLLSQKGLIEKNTESDSKPQRESGKDFNIQLKYKDEFGRELTPKEAFRQLCHRFHGHTSGKAKTEKRLKKIQQELLLKKSSSFGMHEAPLLDTVQESVKPIELDIVSSIDTPVSNDFNSNQAQYLPTIEPNSNTDHIVEALEETKLPESRPKIAFGIKRKLERSLEL